MEQALIQILIQGGAFAVLTWLIWHYVRNIEPKRLDQFTTALETKRRDDQAAMERERHDFTESLAQTRNDFLTAFDRQRAEHTAMLDRARGDYLQASQAAEERHVRAMETQYKAFAVMQEAQRQSCTELTDRLGNSIRILADVMVGRGQKTVEMIEESLRPERAP